MRRTVTLIPVDAHKSITIRCHKVINMKTETVRARIDPVLKGEAEEVIDALGLTPSTVIQMLYKQIVFTRALPFEVKIPNAETLAALAEVRSGRGHKSKSVKEMLAQLKGDDECAEQSVGQPSSRKTTAE